MGNVKNSSPDVELVTGAKLEAASYDKTQKIVVTAGKGAVGGVTEVAEVLCVTATQVCEEICI